MLEHDIESWPEGLEKNVGEGAETISGGQRARIALAIAICNDPKVMLIDDIFSSVDKEVSSKIIKECIVSLKKDKITYSIDILQYANRIIGLDEGTMKFDVDLSHLSEIPIKTPRTIFSGYTTTAI